MSACRFLGCLLLGLVVVTGPAVAADSRVDIEIVGIVPESCSIAVDDSGAVLDLSAGVRQVRVATVTESCNRAGGYTVTVRSAQSGLLSSGAGAIAYQVSYGDQAVDLAGDQTLQRDGPQDGVARDLLVTVPAGNYAEGAYRDVITIEISAQ